MVNFPTNIVEPSVLYFTALVVAFFNLLPYFWRGDARQVWFSRWTLDMFKQRLSHLSVWIWMKGFFVTGLGERISLTWISQHYYFEIHSYSCIFQIQTSFSLSQGRRDNHVGDDSFPKPKLILPTFPGLEP